MGRINWEITSQDGQKNLGYFEVKNASNHSKQVRQLRMKWAFEDAQIVQDNLQFSRAPIKAFQAS